MQALEGITVLELGAYAPVRLATKWLGLMGARVIGIERPREDRPSAYALLDDDRHSHWTGYQLNKESIALNLKSEEGRQILHRLVSKADVFIEGHRPGTLARLGADFDTLSAINSRLIYCSVTGFGQSGPYANMFAHEPNFQGMSGIIARTGDVKGGPPVVSGLAIGNRLGSTMAAIGILAALWQREKTGKGQQIDAPCAMGIIGASGRRYLDELWTTGTLAPRGLWNIQGGHAGFGVYETKDDLYISVCMREPWAWKRFCETVEHPEFIDKVLNADGSPNVALRDEMEALFKTRTRDEWWQLNRKENLGLMPVLEPEEVSEDPHFVEWGMYGEVDYRPVGPIRQVSLPFKMSDSQALLRFMPTFGEHTDAVLSELGYSDAERSELKKNKVVN